ncbi:MAG: excinuclease ABC subunit UvrC [Planctomycetota bacterium]
MTHDVDEQPQRLRDKISALPAEPGVYLFFDDHAQVIYVGKATSLRSRVRSYFQPGSDDGRPLFRFIVRATHDLECIVCNTELEALLLENNLIKKHRPRYNVRLRDDKAYLSLRLTTAEEWPRVQLIRAWKDDGNAYFGPFSSAQSVREMLRVIRKFIPLRTCSNGFFKSRKRPCMEYEIGQCTAPCVGLDDAAGYARMVEETLLFLSGKNQTLIPLLEQKMQDYSTQQQFERAAKVRDQIASIERVFEKQKVQAVNIGDVDIFGLHRKNDFFSIQVFLARDGKLIQSSTHAFRTHLTPGEVLSSFLGQFYAGDRYIPRELFVPFDFDDRPLLEEWLSSRRERRVQVLVPQRGSKKRFVEMASRNAEVNSQTDERLQQSVEALAESLASHLGLGRPVQKVECYDISGIQGTLQVASRVVFEDGEPAPALYRRYKIQSVIGTDDFASMLEVLARRFKPSPKRDPLPDLVVVDGGKGQISSALEALRSLDVDVPVIGLAKQRRKQDKITTERVFVPGRSTPLDLAQDTPESLFLQRIRDEAHRFANTYHRELRRKKQLATGLEEIPGVGKQRREALLRHFGTLDKIRKATLEELTAVPGMTAKSAQATHTFFHGE